MTQYCADRQQGHTLAEHLGGGRMPQDMGAMPWSVDTRPPDRLGRNLADGLVRQGLDGCGSGEKNSVVVPVGEWKAVLSSAFATDLYCTLLPVEVAQR